MNKVICIILLFLISLLISSCASLSKGDCNKGDWAEIGAKDAKKGLLGKKQLQKHQKACAQYQIEPNTKVYNAGYKQGLKQFCRREAGYNHGARGAKYYANCPVSLEQDFLAGYVPGLENELAK